MMQFSSKCVTSPSHGSDIMPDSHICPRKVALPFREARLHEFLQELLQTCPLGDKFTNQLLVLCFLNLQGIFEQFLKEQLREFCIHDNLLSFDGKPIAL